MWSNDGTAVRREIPVGAQFGVAVAAHVAVAAVAGGLHGNGVSGLHIGNLCPYFFNHTHHFMAYGNARNSTRHASMLDVQIA